MPLSDAVKMPSLVGGLFEAHSSTGLGELSSPSGSITLGGSPSGWTPPDARQYVVRWRRLGDERDADPHEAAPPDGARARPPPGPPRLPVRRLGAAVDPHPRPGRLGQVEPAVDVVRRRRRTRAFAWLSLDRGDNDPVRFFMYVIEALRTVAPTIGDTISSDSHAPRVSASSTRCCRC